MVNVYIGGEETKACGFGYAASRRTATINMVREDVWLIKEFHCHYR